MSTLTAPPSVALVSSAFVDSAWPAAYPPQDAALLELDPRSEASGHAAREFVGRYCAAAGFAADICDRAVRCISEIAGNVAHARFPDGVTTFSVCCLQAWPFLVVRVCDPDPHLPTVHAPDLAAFFDDPDEDVEIGGWGLSQVVEVLADYWTACPLASGKCTEFGFAVPWRNRRYCDESQSSPSERQS